jgi:hypothetical protein
MEYLKLIFKDAKLFRYNKGTKDKSIYSGPKVHRVNRNNLFSYVEPITHHQLSNSIHVLLGERPVPLHRKVFYKRISEIDDLVSNSLIRVETVFKPVFKNNKVNKYLETISTKKAFYNSFNPSIKLNWELVRKYMTYNKGLAWGYFVKEFSKILKKNILEYNYKDIESEIRNIKDDTKVKAVFVAISRLGKTALVRTIQTGKNTVTSSIQDGSPILVNSGIEKFEIYNGEILIPVNDFLRERESVMKPFSTILDGGIVFIDGIIDEEDISSREFDKYKKVSDISNQIINH